MNKKHNIYFSLLMLIAVVFASCKNQWDIHNAVTDQSLKINLLQQINQTPSLSKFNEYLVKTGYDKVIASSKTFTVWAPNNDAFANVDAAILNDTAKLKQFIGNHITYETFTTVMPQPSLRIKMLDGKNATFTKTTFEEANILQSNQYVSNGVLHVIDKAIVPKLNIWEYINGLTTVGLKQKAYILSQNYSYQDTSLATIIGVDPVTGKPIPKPGTGIVNKNHYLDQTQNLQNEDMQFTYFVLTDAAYDTESNKVSKYFVTSTTDSTANLSAFNVLKDLPIPTLYGTTASLPDTILSPNNVKVPINKAAVVSQYKASNGIVYVMSSINYRIQDKITPVTVQGENTSFYSRTDKNDNVRTRVRVDPSGVPYRDIVVDGNIGILPASFSLGYKVNTLNSVSYKVYWRAVNEQLTVATAAAQSAPILFSQQLSLFNSFATTFVYGYVSVPYLTYTDVLLGTYTPTRYGYLRLLLTNSTGSTSNQANSLSLDYIKLVPVLP